MHTGFINLRVDTTKSVEQRSRNHVSQTSPPSYIKDEQARTSETRLHLKDAEKVDMIGDGRDSFDVDPLPQYTIDDQSRDGSIQQPSKQKSLHRLRETGKKCMNWMSEVNQLRARVYRFDD